MLRRVIITINELKDEISRNTERLNELLNYLIILERRVIEWHEDDFEEKAQELERKDLTTEQLKEYDEVLALTGLPPTQYLKYNRSKFGACLESMILNHDPHKGVTWQDIENTLQSECSLVKLK